MPLLDRPPSVAEPDSPIGRPPPTLPLWLGAELAVPPDLEASHSAVRFDLRIRQAG